MYLCKQADQDFIPSLNMPNFCWFNTVTLIIIFELQINVMWANTYMDTIYTFLEVILQNKLTDIY